MALEKIVDRKIAEIARLRESGKIPEISSLNRSRRSFGAALKTRRMGFILECKKASPSRGIIRKDYKPVEIARAYAPFADAVSVLADETFFGGSFDHVAEVSHTVDVPVLCKDIVVDPSQVLLARKHGADAVLLMLSVLDDAGFAVCFETATRLSMDSLVEVHDERELERAISLGARIIGVNNRDFRTMRTELAVTERLEPLVPEDRLLVSESGIRARGDVRRLDGRADAVLIGTALMARPDLDRACRELVYGNVKICGITNDSDASKIADAGAIYGGLVFASESPRRVDDETARRLTREKRLAWVGVFVDEGLERVESVAKDLSLAAVQLHGCESASYVSRLRARLDPQCEIWKAHRVGNEIPSLESTGADRLLLDSRVPGAHGGTGRRFDWGILGGRDLSKTILAGGIGADCVRRAEAIGACAIDVCSSVELSPGIKSETSVKRLFENLRSKARRSS